MSSRAAKKRRQRQAGMTFEELMKDTWAARWDREMRRLAIKDAAVQKALGLTDPGPAVPAGYSGTVTNVDQESGTITIGLKR